MDRDIRPSEEQVIAKWRELEFDSLEPVDVGSVWVSTDPAGSDVDVVISEVPVSVEGASTPKYIDIVVVHDLPVENLKDLIYETIDAWSIEDPENPSLNDSGRYIRNLFAVFDPDDRAVSLYEAKVKLHFKAIGQLLSYKDAFGQYYSDIVGLEIRKCGLIYWEADEMCLRTAEQRGFELCQVEFETSELRAEREDSTEFAGVSTSEESQQAQRYSNASNRPDPRVSSSGLETRFPSPRIREEFVILESHRLSQDNSVSPGAYYDDFASDLLGDHVLMSREEFVRAKESPSSTGIGR